MLPQKHFPDDEALRPDACAGFARRSLSLLRRQPVRIRSNRPQTIAMMGPVYALTVAVARSANVAPAPLKRPVPVRPGVFRAKGAVGLCRSVTIDCRRAKAGQTAPRRRKRETNP